MLGKMPGDDWQRFANLRLYYTFMYGHPGKKLLFMGGEFGQASEWNHASSLEWHVLDNPLHAGLQQLVKDLNRLYTSTPALYEVDFDPAGFEWIDCTDAEQSVISFLRRGKDPAAFVVMVCNFTPVVRRDYRIGVPAPGFYRECLNSDADSYGGSGVGNGGGVMAEPVETHGRSYSLNLSLPPLAALVLRPEGY
jgi:1,4-alpha-glucan branching enzyme